MIWIPRDHMVLEVAKPLDEVRSTLERLTDPKGGRFDGKVEGDTFAIRRANSEERIPRVRGKLNATAKGTSVDVTLSLHPVVNGLAIAWLLSILISLASGLAQMSHGGGQARSLITLAVMLLVPYALMIWAFNRQVGRARSILWESFHGGGGATPAA